MKARTLFHVLEDRLQASNEPLTCNDLLLDPEVRKFTDSANRVSDYLGALWRRGVLSRFTAPKTRDSGARWAYAWKKQDTNKKTVSKEMKPPEPSKRPKVEVMDDGKSVLIDLSTFTIIVRGR